MKAALSVLIVLLLAAPAYAKRRFRTAGAAGIPGEYLVVLEDSVPSEHVPQFARQLAGEHGGRLETTWNSALKGFFVKMPEARAVALSRHPLVKFVEENARWHYSGSHATNIDPSTCDPTSSTCSPVTDNRLWHLDRMDQNDAPPSNTYSYCTTGNGVTVYVVDSGVNKNHQEFGPSGARVQAGFNASGDLMPANDPCMGFAIAPLATVEQAPYAQELNIGGHGTAVAALVAGNRIGVAKNATIVPIKVSRCDEYSARRRLDSHAYALNETIFYNPGGATRGFTWRATTVTGPTAASVPSGWPSGAPATGATIQDGGVTWTYVPYTINQTTAMMTTGVNWILSSSNSGPKSHAVVTLSTFAVATDSTEPGEITAFEGAIASLLENGLTVIASANNQNGNACDTTPARMSLVEPNEPGVITVGGSMLVNRPWGVTLSEGPTTGLPEADGYRDPTPYGVEPGHTASAGVRDARWVCGAGDSSGLCSNATSTSTLAPSAGGYYTYQGGSNAGPCVTLFAPAKNVFVASVKSASGYRDARVRDNASGTSWSAPIAAGFAARVLENNGTYGPVDVRTALLANSLEALDLNTLNTRDHNNNEILGTPNKLLHLGDVKITDQPDSVTASGAPTTPLSVTGAGTGTLSYQWYSVNEGFDYVTYPRGAAAPQSSTTVTTNGNGATYNAPFSTTPKAYWVRVSNSCGSAASDIAVVTPAVNPPTNLVASPGSTAGSIALAWTAVANADVYVIERKVGTGAWAALPSTPSSTNYTDSTAPASSAVLYRVRARVDGPPSLDSDPSNVDFSHTWTLAPVSSSTIIRAVHLTGLRRILNQLTDTAGLARQYNDNEALESALLGAFVDHTQFTTLLTRINAVRQQLGLSQVSFPFNEFPLEEHEPLHSQVATLRSALQ